MPAQITGPLFKWFGSKWSSAKHMPSPIYGSIVEPFAGSAGYSLRHARCDVHLRDSDPHLRVLWPWLIKTATEYDIRSIPIDIPEGTDIRTLGLSIGQATLLKSWQRTNSVGDCWTISPWGNKPGQWTANTRARVASEVGCISHWKFLDWDLYEAPGSFLEYPRTWMIDPPYQYNYQYRQAGIESYATLAEHIKYLPGQIIACEAMCPKTGSVPDWLPFEPFRKTVTSRRKRSEHHHSSELLYHRT